MEAAVQKQIQALQEQAQLADFAKRLFAFLMDDLNAGQAYTEARARAVMKTTGALDEPTFNSFLRLAEQEATLRIILYDLIVSGELEEAIAGGQLPTTNGQLSWLPLIIAACAHKSGYPLSQLDPSSPPAPHSPAGLMLQQAAGFIRRQTQRTATERDRMAKRLAYRAAAAQSLDDMAENRETVAPVPPHFRSPVPVRYPEYNPEVHLEDADAAEEASPDAPSPTPPLPPNVERGDPIKITKDDISPPPPPARRMPPITITREQVTPQVRTGRSISVPQPNPQGTPSALTQALRNLFSSEEMKTTKLRIRVQEYPDGPGLYGLQVRVSCKGIRSHVAGTTDRNGRFVCELPVRLHSGLTYDVDVTWPRDEGGETERKSITLNADRTQFTLPFYRRLGQ